MMEVVSDNFNDVYRVALHELSHSHDHRLGWGFCD